MSLEIVTKEDLHEFRKQLLVDLKEILNPKIQPQKPWLKGYEVRKLLNISPGTLQTLRTTGVLAHTKIGGTLYYDFLKIDELMRSNMKSLKR
ncbi:helix-turn-helix domain-containing protein [Fluviicola taffensis]|uniref:Helix-turn-helix domain-containing protein n=1 Tax=Fluviicola taffensis (strain DSM 16823 / NCIMB 13979 / RW262) TaxID=755732 RepID=F2IGR5_FLUTR|nr:helix-turn-helix domain-containing protein [Fluviicola taffensis]AEA43682.1 hypothetical protein Fluta_1690 [Fluviicola taffensis DSM 16823]